MSADSGYLSAENIQAEGKGIELLIASGRERKEEDRESKEGRVYSLKRFCYDKEGEGWRCPGGLVVNTNAQVINTQGEVIPGLYATSNTTALLSHGFTYTSGSCQGKSMIFGYIAARHMARSRYGAGPLAL